MASRKVAIAVGAGYAASSLLARANFTHSKPHEIYFGVNAAGIAALALLKSHGFLASAFRVSFVLRALALVAFAAMKRSDLNDFDAMTRWDGIATAVGVSLVVSALFGALLPGSRVRWAYQLAFLLAIVPLIAVLPKLFGLARVHRPTLVRAASLSKLSTDTPRGGPGDVYDAETDTSALFVEDVDVMPGTRTLFVAFNGTRSKATMASDTNLGSKNIGSWLKKKTGGAEPRVHAGFGLAFGAVRGLVLQRVQDFAAGSAGQKRRVVFVGHSLGGGVATIAGLVTADAMSTDLPVEVYTFGSPAAGDGTFVGLFDRAVSNSVRVVEPLDPIPRGSVTQFAHVRGFYPVSTARRDNVSQHRIDTYISAIAGGAANTALGFLIPTVIAFAAIVPVVGADVWLHRRSLASVQRSLAKNVSAVVVGG